MEKEIEIKLKINFPEYEDVKAAIKECKRKFESGDYEYTSDVTYEFILVTLPHGFYRIYSSDDVNFDISFDEMEGGYLSTWKKFKLNKKSYQELIEYATEKIRTSVKVW